jgi:murein DD-endopeptidase MepM/ murein hydrolase activator NlpD
MNLILVSDRLAKSHSVTLGTGKIFLLLTLLFTLMLAAAFALQYSLVRFAPETVGEGLYDLLSRAYIEERQKQEANVLSSLDTMASRIGKMQSQVQRLDALGVRLAKLTGMKPSEFQFDQLPAQGGPLVILPTGQMSVSMLDTELNRMTQVVGDRTDKLMALETMLLQNQLSQKLLPTVQPVDSGWYSSNFGWRIDPFTGANAMHEGVDFMVPEGTPIHASAGGVVAFASTHPQYGNMVEIDHGNDIVTRYAHCSKLLVKVGQVVRRGEKIAEVGSTGRSTGNHLHFEIRYQGIAQNPVRFLQKSAS